MSDEELTAESNGDLIAILKDALVPEDAVDIILALVTRAYDDGYTAGVSEEGARLIAAISPAKLSKPGPTLGTYVCHKLRAWFDTL